MPVALLGALLVVGLVAALVVWLWPGDGMRPSADDGTGQTQEPTSQSPSPTPTDSPSDGRTSEEVVAEMEGFITEYLATVTSDPRAGFEMLTPQFQAASGGYGRYLGWWRTVESATPTRFDADAEGLSIGYTVSYVMRNGDERTEDIRLQLQRQGEEYLIAGEG